MTNALSLQPRQVELVRHTIASDCNNAEFDLFMEAARSYGLDPFRKQIIPLVFSKNDEKKRRMSIVVSRDGLRVIAQRCKNYRPASEPAQVVYDDALVGPTNPKGIVSATVRLWQQDNNGEWFPVIGEADWDEFAPVADEWAFDEASGKRKPTGKRVLDASGNWARMPKIMIVKCAEAQALRAGWPDQFGGIYAEEELDRTKYLDLSASEIVENEKQERRLAMTSGKDAIMIAWLPGMPLEPVPVGQMADRAVEWLQDTSRTFEQVDAFSSINSASLRQFWAKEPNDALAVKRVVERRLQDLKSSEEAA